MSLDIHFVCLYFSSQIWYFLTQLFSIAFRRRGRAPDALTGNIPAEAQASAAGSTPDESDWLRRARMNGLTATWQKRTPQPAPRGRRNMRAGSNNLGQCTAIFHEMPNRPYSSLVPRFHLLCPPHLLMIRDLIPLRRPNCVVNRSIGGSCTILLPCPVLPVTLTS